MKKFSLLTGVAALATIGAAFSTYVYGETTVRDDSSEFTAAVSWNFDSENVIDTTNGEVFGYYQSYKDFVPDNLTDEPFYDVEKVESDDNKPHLQALVNPDLVYYGTEDPMDFLYCVDVGVQGVEFYPEGSDDDFLQVQLTYSGTWYFTSDSSGMDGWKLTELSESNEEIYGFLQDLFVDYEHTEIIKLTWENVTNSIGVDVFIDGTDFIGSDPVVLENALSAEELNFFTDGSYGVELKLSVEIELVKDWADPAVTA